jgi:hypothetical protein
VPRRNYISCDLGALFQEQGLQPDTKYLSSATKVLSFRKPVPGEAPAGPVADPAGLE